MCEPTTLAAIGSWFAGTAGTAGATTTAAATTAAAAGTAAAGTAAATTAAAGMTAAQMISLGLSAGSGLLGAYGAYQQGQAAETVARNNAKMAEYAAQDAQRRGEEEAIAVQRRGAALRSNQRVGMAAKGLDLSYGTAADLQDQTDFFTQSDIATTRTNAAREAWNMRARGQDMLAQGRAEGLNSMLAAGGSLLGTAGQVADKWYTYTTPPKKA